MSDSSPILNNPYDEPQLHYWTSASGEVDYNRIEAHRRPFVPDVRSIPVEVGPQGQFFSEEEVGDEWKTHPINLIRREVGAWREARYPQTTRITR